MLRLILHAGAERLAIPGAAVAEVLPAVERHPLAGPPWLAGAIRRRGAVLPVVDLCRLVGGGDCLMSLHTRIVVIDGARPVGLLAERVGELREFAAADGLVADADGLVRLTDLATLLPPGGLP